MKDGKNKRLSKRAKINRRFYIMAAVTVIYVVLALFADRFAPYDPVEADPAMSLCPPSAEHLFGTDKLGRDVFSRILCGAGTSFTMSFIMITFVSVLGTSIGMLCGYFGGTVDTVIMRFVDILLADIALGLLSWTGFARMARSLTASIRERGFVEQARFNGASEVRILAKYILPNVIPQIVVMAAMRVGGTMLALASLSYLGLASQPPTPEWGVMVSESRAYMQTAPWMMIFPGLALFITVVVFNLFGDSIRDYLDIKK